jgi:hypothetical protein
VIKLEAALTACRQALDDVRAWSEGDLRMFDSIYSSKSGGA